MASLPYDLVKAEQLVDGRLTTMLNYADNSTEYAAHTLDKRTFFGRKCGACVSRVVGSCGLALLLSSSGHFPL